MMAAVFRRPWHPQLTVILRIVALSNKLVLEVRSQATNEHLGTSFAWQERGESIACSVSSWENACAFFVHMLGV